MIKRIGLEILKLCTQKREYYMICRTPPIMSGSILHLLRTLDYYYVGGTRYSIDIRLIPFHNRVYIFNHSQSPDIYTILYLSILITFHPPPTHHQDLKQKEIDNMQLKLNLIYLLTLTLASLSAASPAAETGAAVAAGTDSGAQPPAPTSTGSSSSSDSDSSSPYQQCAKKYTSLPLPPNKPHIHTHILME